MDRNRPHLARRWPTMPHGTGHPRIDRGTPGETGVIVDVRSPSEYARGHWPGSVNVPLFSDTERAEVGTTQTQGRHKAYQGLASQAPN